MKIFICSILAYYLETLQLITLEPTESSIHVYHKIVEKQVLNYSNFYLIDSSSNHLMKMFHGSNLKRKKYMNLKSDELNSRRNHCCMRPINVVCREKNLGFANQIKKSNHFFYLCIQKIQIQMKNWFVICPSFYK